MALGEIEQPDVAFEARAFPLPDPEILDFKNRMARRVPNSGFNPRFIMEIFDQFFCLAAVVITISARVKLPSSLIDNQSAVISFRSPVKGDIAPKRKSRFIRKQRKGQESTCAQQTIFHRVSKIILSSCSCQIHFDA